MNCSTHPDRPAYDRCSDCGKDLCMECSVKTDSGTLCQACLMKAKTTDTGIMAPVNPTRPTPATAPVAQKTSYGRAILFGLITAVVAAWIWELSVVLTNYKLGIIAVGIGFAVGVAVTVGARRVDSIGVPAIGAVLAGFGILFGEYLIGYNYVTHLPADKQVLAPALFTLLIFPKFLAVEMGFMGWVFVAIGVYEGWKVPMRNAQQGTNGGKTSG